MRISAKKRREQVKSLMDKGITDSKGISDATGMSRTQANAYIRQIEGREEYIEPKTDVDANIHFVRENFGKIDYIGIAVELNVSTSTARRYISKIKRELGIPKKKSANPSGISKRAGSLWDAKDDQLYQRSRRAHKLFLEVRA